ncbi:MAG: hypothetical protein FWD49_06290, partial [Firmicutes bacterium]|nr:hypothetical protein [Bacillota bacterium]
NDEESPQGNLPKDFSHQISANATSYDSTADKEKIAMLNGVYDRRKINSDNPLVKALMESETFKEGLFLEGMDDEEILQEIIKFLTESGHGNNYLLMANLRSNGQSYMSSSSFTLDAESFYEITIWAKILLPAGQFAEFRFEYGTETMETLVIRVISDGSMELKPYTFYIYNEKSSSVSNNRLSFHLGTNTNTTSGSTPTGFVKGMMLIDSVSYTKLSREKSSEGGWTNEAYESAKEAYEALTDTEKRDASVKTHFFEAEEIDDSHGHGNDDHGGGRTPLSPDMWLMISSIIIGAMILAVLIAVGVKNIRKRIGKSPVKVLSNVPVNQINPDEKKTVERGKDDIDDETFDD